jgi:hypothetical protein
MKIWPILAADPSQPEDSKQTTQNEKLEIGYEILFILLVLQAGSLSQAA